MRYLKYLIAVLCVALIFVWQQLKGMIVAEGPLQEVVNVVIPKRSEERRVGKECRL